MDLLNINDRPGEYPGSWYAATVSPPAPRPALEGEVTADLCVIGGGYTGLSAALHAAEAGLSVVLLEAQRVGFGASGRNGGQVGTGQRIDQDALEKMVGQTRARALWDMGLDSVSLVKSLIDTHGIDCAWTPGIIHADHRERFVPEHHAYVEKLVRDYGYDRIRPLDRDGIRALVGSPGYHGGALDMGGAHVHPLAYALGLARAATKAGVTIHESSRVIEIKSGAPSLVRTATGTVRARHVILGTNGYLGNLAPSVARRVMPINNFIVATEPLSETFARSLIRDNHAVADSRFVVNYFRLSRDRRMLFGGGESYGWRFPADIAAKVRKPMLEVYPQLADVKIDYAWGGTLAITMSRMPDLQRLGPNILSASGYSGHGVAMATLAGKLAAETIAGDAAGFDLLAGVPTPTFPGGAALRWPLLVLAMTWFSLRDRL